MPPPPGAVGGDRGTPVLVATRRRADEQRPSAASEIKPHSGDIPDAAAKTGPAEGATAIGGMSGGKQDGGASKGGASAPTGGDGTKPDSDTQKTAK